MTEQPTTPDLITPQQAAEIVDRGAVVFDVRSAESRRDHGLRLPNAIEIDRDRLAELFAPDAVSGIPALAALDQEVVVYCGSEKGSQPVADWLVGNGYTNVSHIDGGIHAWIADGRSTESNE